MVSLAVAILCSALVSIFVKLSNDRISGNISMLAMNYVMCMFVAGITTGVGNLISDTPGFPKMLALSLLNGFLYLTSFLLLQINVKRSGVVLPSVFMRLGLLVPMVLSIFLFGEIPGILQAIGFALALGAIVLINSGAEKSEAGFDMGLILLLLVGGSADAMSKVFEEIGNPALSSQFIFYTFFTALLLCVGYLMWKKERLGLPEVIFGFLVGIPNFFSARFLLRALEDLDAVIVYPTFSVGTILVVTFAGVLFFHERLDKKQWLAVAVILAALILLNI